MVVQEGNTAMSLLAAYYRDHEGTDGNEKCYALKMVEAVVKAPYYLDMVLYGSAEICFAKCGICSCQ